MTTLVEFNNDAALKNIDVGKGVSIARTDDNALEVRVTPFAEHGNKWPLIAFGPRFFGRPINLANHSRLETVLHHQSKGMSCVDLQFGTSPDTSRGVDNHRLLVPGHTSMPVKMPIELIRSNDPSNIAVIQMIFRPRETETIYHIEPIRAVYDPAMGSPVADLLQTASSMQNQFNAVTSQLHQAEIATLTRRIAELSRDLATARSQRFYKAHRSLSQRVHDVVGDIGRLRFMGAGALWVWEPDRYPNILRRTGPNLHTEPLKQLALSMAGNEFRDCVIMISAADRDLSLNIALRSIGDAPLPAEAVEIRRTTYLKNPRGEETGDALLPIECRVPLPAGESRQLWIRFDTRTTNVTPGQYSFELAIGDEANQVEQVLPGELTVWDFNLPSYDVLPNNSYAIFGANFGSGDAYRQAVQHMKLYGLNHIFIEPPTLPRPTGLDDQWHITGYDDDAFMYRVVNALKAWHDAPGDDTLNFIVSLSGFYELGLQREGYAFPNEQWKYVFAQWLDHFKSLMEQAELDKNRWMLVLRDESGEPALMNFEIPLAETIKSIDSSIRITCNTSTILSDTHWSMRFFKAFDVFQPHLGYDLVLEWLRLSGKPVWVYQCETSLPVMGRDLYDYYRLYPWDMLEHGFVGTGVWTYYSAPHDRPWNEDFQGCQLIYMHPQQGLVHSRRYEIFREGLDDYRYVIALRRVATDRGAHAVQEAKSLIQNAVQDITTHRQDRQRCEMWRTRIAEMILALR